MFKPYTIKNYNEHIMNNAYIKEMTKAISIWFLIFSIPGCSVGYNKTETYYENEQDQLIMAACSGGYTIENNAVTPNTMVIKSPELYKQYTDCVQNLTLKSKP